MKIDYIKLENIAGLVTGSNIHNLEIDFKNSKNKLINIAGENGKGKALPNDTRIPTPSGDKEMGEIKVGDYVFGSDGKPTKVIGVFPQDRKKEIYEIIFEDGRKVKASDDHLWKITDLNKNKSRVTTTKRIYNRYKGRTHGKLVIPTLSSPADYGETIRDNMDDDFTAALNGRNLREGWDKIYECVADGFIHGSIDDRWDVLTNTIGCTKEELIKGISSDKGYIYRTKSYDTLNELEEIIYSLGLTCTTRRTPGNDWRLYPHGGDNDIIEIHKPPYLHIKHMRRLKEKEWCTCIKVEADDQLFLCGDYIVTHNSVLISSLTPFAYQTSVDERSSLPYILSGKQGYKEIHFKENNDEYLIKHYYKPTKGDSHTVKSYFSKNGEELNQNGNTTSFNSLVELYFGITPDMMRLLRLGTNVNSFISLSPARRKEYIGKLIDEINVYLKIFKKLNEDVRVVKTLLNVNNQNLYNTHIEDIEEEKSKVKELKKYIEKKEKEHDKIVAKLSTINNLIQNNDINKLQKQRQESEAQLHEFDKINNDIKLFKLENTNLDKLMNKRNNLSSDKLDIKSKIQSYKMSIDRLYVTIDRLDRSIKKITSGNDLKSLHAIINDLKYYISNVPNTIKQFTPYNISTNEIIEVLSKLNSFNKLGTMIYSLGNKPLKIYIKLLKENIDIEKWLDKQAKKLRNNVSKDDIQLLLDSIFEEDDIIEPNCTNQYKDCPYYRLSEVIYTIHDKYEDVLDSETLQYIKVIYQNMLNIFNSVYNIRQVNLPKRILNELSDEKIIERLQLKETLFTTDVLESYLSLYSEWTVYQERQNQLKNYEHQLSVYKQSGINVQEEEIQEARESVEFYKSNIKTLENRLVEVDNDIEHIDHQITLVSKYNDSKKFYKVIHNTLINTNKLLKPLESAQDEKRDLEYELRSVDNEISRNRIELKKLEGRIEEYKKLLKDGKKLNKEFIDISAIMNAVSTKKGIPVIYMGEYLRKIQSLANQLLSLIYDGELMLSNFKITQDTFEIPYIKNGSLIPDVKYSSQSELSLITMALSFALSYKASGNYNILLLDEIDAGLDEYNRHAFLKMLDQQIEMLDAEQVFIISHNISQMANIPMDVIQLSDISTNKLQNVIYGT